MVFNIVSFMTIEDVVELSLTCHSIRSMLLISGRPAIHQAAARSVFAFEDALRVTRAKLLPVSSIQQFFRYDLAKREYTNPPESSFFEDLSASPLTLIEAPKMLKLQAIVAAWELNLKEVEFDYDPEWWLDSVSEGYYRASYRYMLFGVIFSQVYLYPVQLLEEAYAAKPESVRREKEIRRYPVVKRKSKLWCSTQMERLLAGFGEWLVADGARRAELVLYRKSQENPDYEKLRIEYHEEFEGRDKPLTYIERGSLTEVMLVFSVMQDSDIVSRHLVLHPQEIQDIKGLIEPLTIIVFNSFYVFNIQHCALKGMKGGRILAFSYA